MARRGEETGRRHPLTPESLREFLARPDFMTALMRHETSSSLIEEFVPRFGDTRDLLRLVDDVEIEFEPEHVELLSSYDHPIPHIRSYSQPPAPPRFEQLEMHSQHSYNRGMYWKRGQSLACFSIHFGDHREPWYVRRNAFDNMTWGSPRDYEETEAACIALTVAVRRQIRALLDQDDGRVNLRHRLPKLTWNGRRAGAWSDYDQFVALGELPRAHYVQQVPVTREFIEDEEALVAATARMMPRSDAVEYARLLNGEWPAEADMAEGGGDLTVITNGNGGRVVQRNNISISFRDVNENGMWFDYHTINREIDTRAEGLLLDHLTDAQRDEYVQHKRITLEAKSGTMYVVHRARTYNVTQLSAKTGND